MNKINEWAEAIKKHEGYFPGSASYRNNNPGNFRCSGLVMGEFGATKCVNNLAVFPTYEKGWQALKQFLIYACTDQLRSYKKTMTLLDFYKVYAPSADKNNPLGYATAVAKDMGVSIDTKIGSFFQEETPTNAVISIENQLDAKWKGHFLGSSASGYQGFGCKLFALRYLYCIAQGRNVSIDEVDDLLFKGGAYFKGDMLDDAKAAKILGLEFLGKETDIEKAPDWSPTIKEVDFSIAGGKQQHFVVRIINPDGSKAILDPYGGVERKVNFYEQKVGEPNWEKGKFSYRLFRIKQPAIPIPVKIVEAQPEMIVGYDKASGEILTTPIIPAEEKIEEVNLLNNKSMQTENSFDKETMKKIGKGALIAGGGAILTYCAENIGNIDFGVYTPLVVAILSIVINMVKEYRKGV